MIGIEAVSETSLIITLGNEIDPELSPAIAELCQRIREACSEELLEVIPSYTTILVQYHPLRTGFKQLKNKLENLVADLDANTEQNKTHKIIRLPVYYAEEVGPDLQVIAARNNLSVAEVITKHSQRNYTVCAIGFAPGFAFLAPVDPAIATPRHSEPRIKIPAGSVGIADNQTAVYPAASPGGWQIIGNCPQPLFDPTADPMMPFEVGDTVRFVPVTRDEYLAQGGCPCPDWK